MHESVLLLLLLLLLLLAFVPAKADGGNGRWDGAITRTSGLGEASLSGLPKPASSSVFVASAIDALQRPTTMT
jgi:hypothetical protein